MAILDLAFSKMGGAWIDEEELELLVEEYALPLDQGCSQWDELVDESNRYFKRQYKEGQKEAAATNWQGVATPSHLGRPIASLFDLSAAVVAAYFTPELRACLPDDVVTAVQKHMPKDRQIECLREHKRWDETSKVVVKHCPYDAQARKHGQAIERRPSGVVWRTTWYQAGSRTGNHIEYFANGKKSLKVQYRDERIDGHIKWWYESGQLAGVQTFANGLKNGSGHVWHEDGALWRSKSYKDDRKHGIFRTFDQTGKVLKCRRYDTGRKRKDGATQLTTSWPGIALSLPLETPMVARV
jgi:hypothetical protein